eukprot:TRINITY_DN50_c0_g1_i4.p1 TRINITY_DN50_c0_g1~~TRINITY_DN50_c0_g1_i4.p1  ORF type:complete len:1177 (+),score=258.27 TRINITY_DN50_c0_g1_i4:61-3591(+)
MLTRTILLSVLTAAALGEGKGEGAPYFDDGRLWDMYKRDKATMYGIMREENGGRGDGAIRWYDVEGDAPVYKDQIFISVGGRSPSSCRSRALATEGDALYVACDNGVVMVWNITYNNVKLDSLSNPGVFYNQIVEYPMGHTKEHIRGIAQSTTHLYVTFRDGVNEHLYVLEKGIAANGISLTKKGSLELTNAVTTEMAYHNGKLYLTTAPVAYDVVPITLSIINVADPDAPALLSTHSLGTSDTRHRIGIHNGFLYKSEFGDSVTDTGYLSKFDLNGNKLMMTLPSMAGGSFDFKWQADKLHVGGANQVLILEETGSGFDISNVYPLPNGMEANAVLPSGIDVFASSTERDIYRLPTPTELREVGTIDSTQQCVELAWRGNYTYCALTDGPVDVYSVADETKPTLVTSMWGDGNANSVLISGDYLYIAFEREVVKCSLADPAHPAIVHRYAAPSGTIEPNWRGLAKSDSYIFVALLKFSTGASIYVLDAATLAEVGTVALSTASDAPAHLAYRSGKVFATTNGGEAKFIIFDVSDPTNPSELSMSSMAPHELARLTFHNNNLYLSTGVVGSKQPPVLVDPVSGSYTALNVPEEADSCTDMQFHNGRLYLACGANGLVVLQEAAPHTFVLLAKDATKSPWSLVAGNGHLFVSGTEDRLSVYRLRTSPLPAVTPSPTPAPTPAPTLASWGIGCYADSSGSRQLPHLAYNGPQNTVESCVERCHSGGYSFAGVEFGSECWCGNSMSGAVRHIASDCEELECTGDSSTKCGGDGRMKVYQFTEPVAPHTPVLEGCFDDSVTERKLPHLAYTDKKLTNGECATICQSRGYKYSGTQDGSQCWCGDDISTSARVDPAKCSTACSGDSAQKCGGYLRGTVYRVVPMVPPHTPVLEGCFKDGRTRRLSHHAFSSPLNTVWECTRTCQHNGYKYAGLQYGKQCWCGDDLSTSTRTVMSQCDDPCSGDSTQTCGGGWRNQVYSVSPVAPRDTFSYMGCFRDYSSNRQFPVYAYSDSKLNSVEKCTRTCQHNGYKYAGLQYGKQCWCGDDLSTSTRTTMSQCDDPCSGDSTQTCGGGYRNQVYSLVPVAPRESFRYAGCYRDYQSSRQFPVYAYSDRNGNNVEECTRTCQHNGYAVAGLQNGNQCWCGNDLGSRKSLPEYLCRTPCPGDTSVTCGAPWYNSVWATLK